MSLRYEQAETLLVAIGLYSELSEYDPLFVGTLPIDIDIEGSDIDIICEATDLDELARRLSDAYSDQTGFITEKRQRQGDYLVCRFSVMTFDIEIYAEDKPVKQQNAYLHMEAERKLLLIGGEGARGEIRRLKRNGLKTEPAFARYFKLEGDPYDTVLELADLSISEILSRVG
ncbi:MAG: DUF4269 domain-containing protein [Sneathiellales bacterium]|nr:DUF4269 domain-containing protein [Sneathiellales bacterium]